MDHIPDVVMQPERPACDAEEQQPSARGAEEQQPAEEEQVMDVDQKACAPVDVREVGMEQESAAHDDSALKTVASATRKLCDLCGAEGLYACSSCMEGTYVYKYTVKEKELV